MQPKYTMLIQWSEADKLYLVHLPEFPWQQFVTHGKTYEEAARNGEDAIAGLIEVLQNSGQPIPEPTAFITSQVA
jgi:predicted RNase H-like HicB family nuclease